MIDDETKLKIANDAFLRWYGLWPWLAKKLPHALARAILPDFAHLAAFTDSWCFHTPADSRGGVLDHVLKPVQGQETYYLRAFRRSGGVINGFRCGLRERYYAPMPLYDEDRLFEGQDGPTMTTEIGTIKQAISQLLAIGSALALVPVELRR